MNIFWFLPTHGDGRYLGTPYGARAVSYRYLKQIAEAADDLGFGGVLLPTGRSCEDAWAVASSLIAATRNLRFLVAIRPGIISPTAAARLTSTVDRLSEGRLSDQRRHGRRSRGSRRRRHFSFSRRPLRRHGGVSRNLEAGASG